MAYWLKIILSLCAIWVIAAGAIYLAHSRKPTAESITAYLDKHRIDDLGGTGRRKTIEDVEGMLNRITREEREKLRGDHVTDKFFKSLTPEEQSSFLDATLPAGFKQMMESFNKMDPKKRKEFVDRTLEEMKKHQGENQPRNLDNNARKIVDQGLRSFYSDSTPEVKLDLAPLIEQMQANLQGPR